jgi:hypothetical protein
MATNIRDVIKVQWHVGERRGREGGAVAMRGRSYAACLGCEEKAKTRTLDKRGGERVGKQAVVLWVLGGEGGGEKQADRPLVPLHHHQVVRAMHSHYWTGGEGAVTTWRRL